MIHMYYMYYLCREKYKIIIVMILMDDNYLGVIQAFTVNIGKSITLYMIN